MASPTEFALPPRIRLRDELKRKGHEKITSFDDFGLHKTVAAANPCGTGSATNRKGAPQCTARSLTAWNNFFTCLADYNRGHLAQGDGAQRC